MNDIVLLFPYKGIASKHIQTKPKYFIYPLIRAKASMAGVMHNIKPDGSQHKAKQASQHDYKCKRQVKNKENSVDQNSRRNQYSRFQK